MDPIAWLEDGRIDNVLRIIVLLGLGWPLLYVLRRVLGRVLRERLSVQGVMLSQKAVYFGGLTLLAVMVLNEMGFNLSAILGAAGIVGVAVGFASQTSLSNIISGVFLLSEKPFTVGDVITVGGTTGVVMSVDLLSVKLRTFDNQFVRLPNENLIKSELVNVTRFPIRRMDITVGVAYKEDLAKVLRVLRELAAANPLVLREPAPLLVVSRFGDSAVEILFGVWFDKPDFLELKNNLMQEIKARFDAEGIEIPFPHLTLYAGEATKPFPVRVAEK